MGGKTLTLIVEDGTQVTDANSYASLTTIKAYATLRGIVLSINDTVIENQAIKAMDYIEGKRNQFDGYKVSNTQSLQFPRCNLTIDGFEFPLDAIPNELIKAQSQLVCEQALGVDILPTLTEPPVRKEVVGPIETEYAVAIGSSFDPVIPSVENLLQPLYKSGSTSFALTTVRV